SSTASHLHSAPTRRSSDLLTEISSAPTFAFVGPHLRRNNQGGFLDFRYSPHPRATLSFGGRAEANAIFGTRVVPRVGASLALLQDRKSTRLNSSHVSISYA